MKNNKESLILTKTITGFCIDSSRWYYEGDSIEFISKTTGKSSQGIISFVNAAAYEAVFISNETPQSIDLNDIEIIEK